MAGDAPISNRALRRRLARTERRFVRPEQLREVEARLIRKMIAFFRVQRSYAVLADQAQIVTGKGVAVPEVGTEWDVGHQARVVVVDRAVDYEPRIHRLTTTIAELEAQLRALLAGPLVENPEEFAERSLRALEEAETQSRLDTRLQALWPQLDAMAKQIEQIGRAAAEALKCGDRNGR